LGTLNLNILKLRQQLISAVPGGARLPTAALAA
jgi:hypothetical protein